MSSTNNRPRVRRSPAAPVVANPDIVNEGAQNETWNLRRSHCPPSTNESEQHLSSSPVANNVQLIVGLINDVSAALGAIAFKSFTDAGEPFPFNAHTAYYACASDVSRDLSLIQQLIRGNNIKTPSII